MPTLSTVLILDLLVIDDFMFFLYKLDLSDQWLWENRFQRRPQFSSHDQ